MDQGAGSYRRYLDGDDAGMEQLVRMYMDGLFQYLNSILHDPQLAEDCVQDTFIRLAVRKPKFRGRSSFRTWLYAIGRNTALSALRKAGRRGTALAYEPEILSADGNPERDIFRTEQRTAVRLAVQKLKPDYRQILYLSYFEGFSNPEAARIMGKSKRQIENLLANAKKALRRELEKEGFDYEEL